MQGPATPKRKGQSRSAGQDGADMMFQDFALVQFGFRLFSELARGFALWWEKVWPQVLQIAEVLKRLEAGPTTPGYEALLIGCGTPPFESRLLAVAIVRCGDRLKSEDDARRSVSSAFRRVAKAAGRSTLAISRRAKELKAALGRPEFEDATAEALHEADPSISIWRLGRILDRVIDRDCDACDSLKDLAHALVAHLADPRGRPLSVTTASHQLLLHYFTESGKPLAYTWNDLARTDCRGDFADKATFATREAFGDPSFDPRPAHRRRKGPRTP
nr:hypothetical protein [Methylocapsa sp. RX1]